MERSLNCDSEEEKSLCVCAVTGVEQGSDIPVLPCPAHCSRGRGKPGLQAKPREWWLTAAPEGCRAACSVPPVTRVTPEIPRDVPVSHLWDEKWRDNGEQFEHCVIWSVLGLWEGNKALKSNVAALSVGEHWVIWLNIPPSAAHVAIWLYVLIWFGIIKAERKDGQTLVLSKSLDIQLFLNNQECLIKK